MNNIKILESEFNSDSESLSALLEYNLKNNIIQDISNSTFVDVGAGMPEFYSNSLMFRNLGCKVISIEPIPSFCEMFRQRNWDVLKYAVVIDDSETSVLFTEMKHSHIFQGLSGSAIKGVNMDSTNSPEKVFSEYEVKCMSLNSLLQKYYPELNQIDILDIDTEGGEIEILRGFDFEKYKPKVLIIENLNPHTNGYYDFYKEINYRLVSICAHNDILIRE